MSRFVWRNCGANGASELRWKGQHFFQSWICSRDIGRFRSRRVIGICHGGWTVPFKGDADGTMLGTGNVPKDDG